MVVCDGFVGNVFLKSSEGLARMLAAYLQDEFLAFAYAREYGLEVVPFRLFNTVGVGQSGRYGMVIPRFVTQALRGVINDAVSLETKVMRNNLLGIANGDVEADSSKEAMSGVSRWIVQATCELPSMSPFPSSLKAPRKEPRNPLPT